MVFSCTVKFSASWCSSEVLVDSTASTSISPLPWVTRLAPGTRRSWSPSEPRRQRILLALVQETQQQQELNYNHCGMAVYRKMFARIERDGTPDPIKELAFASAVVAKTNDPAHETLATRCVPLPSLYLKWSGEAVLIDQGRHVDNSVGSSWWLSWVFYSP